MGVKNQKVLQAVFGWEAVEIVFNCLFIGLWQLLKLTIRKLWKGRRRKISKNVLPVELTVDSSIGVHCHIKIMGIKYHYVETGPRTGKKVLILGDAPDTGKLWVPSWCSVVRRLAELDHHVITLDLRGTGGSEGGHRRDLSPPKAVNELVALLKALGVSDDNPANIIGFGIGGMLTWYLVHCQESLIRKFAVVGAPHPNLYWQYPPAPFCKDSLQFIQWPHFPEKWLADCAMQEGSEWTSSRARDWSGALNYVRGAAWWRVRSEARAEPRALLVGARSAAASLVASAQYCTHPALRLVADPGPADPELPNLIMDFFVGKQKPPEDIPRGLMGRVFGAVAGRGKELTARLVLPVNA